MWGVSAGDVLVLCVCVVCALLCMVVCRCMYRLRGRCASIDIGLCVFGIDVSMCVVFEVVSGTLYLPLYNRE